MTTHYLKGAPVTGEYNVWGVCPIPTPGDVEGTKCYQGMLHIHVPKGAQTSVAAVDYLDSGLGQTTTDCRLSDFGCWPQRPTTA